MRRAVLAVTALLVGLGGGGTVGLLARGPGPQQALIRVELPTPGSSPIPPQVQLVVPDTLLAWTPGGLPEGLAGEVGDLPGVDHVVAVVSGAVWMEVSLDPSGAVVDRAPAGLGFPLEVAGANLSDYAPFLSPGDRTLLPRLAAGEAALGSTSAGLRRLGPGGALTLTVDTVRVAGVLPDAAIGAHEVFVSRATATALGVTRERYLLIDPSPDATREVITSRIRALLPAGLSVQIRGPGETPYFRQGDAVLAPVRLKELFGEFAGVPSSGGYIRSDPLWEAAHIVTDSVPILGSVRCHRSLIPQLRGALRELESAGLAGLVDPGGNGGCYSSRFINRNPAVGISHHAWGVAVDINAPDNPYGATPHQDPRLVAIFERWGFTWGGSWIVPDGMHFEFVAFPSGS